MKKQPNDKPSYDKLGASHQKEDVHSALIKVDKGLYPNAFCKIIEDVAGDPNYCSIVHADGAGTKTAIAYMMYKETGSLEYFKGIVQDSIVMNVDDVLCVGASSYFLLSNTLGRNKKLIDGNVVATIINAYEDFVIKLRNLGLPIHTCGGETADLGDIVRTLVVDSTLVSRMPRTDVIVPENIQNSDVIVGLSSTGKAIYEDLEYNSGIASNGLTLARHGLLSHEYFNTYPECVSPELEEKWAYFGKYRLSDRLPDTPLTIGQAILSPTRSYAPILLKLFNADRQEIHAIFHNTGGGQTKCLKFGSGIHYFKTDLFPTPPLFKTIQTSSDTEWREMYQVFNMGHRMEIVCNEKYATEVVIPIAKSFGVEAKIIGHIEIIGNGLENRLTLESENGIFEYQG